MLFLRASWNATGISIASAPMFFTNADSSATAPASTATCAVGRRQVGRDAAAAACSTTPERCTAALTSSAHATMITMSSEKPENALS